MKSQYQTLAFLGGFRPKSDLDSEMIFRFIDGRYNITPKTVVFSTDPASPEIDSQTFLDWYERSYSTAGIARYDSQTVMIGRCLVDGCYIEFSIGPEGFHTPHLFVSYSDLESASIEEGRALLLAMLEHRTQLDPETLLPAPRYVPEPGDRVIFFSNDRSVQGMGAIRSIDRSSHDVEFFCYFIYPTKQNEKVLGYSMHEKGIANLYEYTFEPMSTDKERACSLNGSSCLARLNRELAKVGKIWKNTRQRVEPLDMSVTKGNKYWYINDKLQLVQDTEKDTPKSHFRLMSGNYFIDEKAGAYVLSRLKEDINNYLASDKWPEI